MVTGPIKLLPDSVTTVRDKFFTSPKTAMAGRITGAPRATEDRSIP
jgi:hypothetical protein